jgi:hypothetical protein
MLATYLIPRLAVSELYSFVQKSGHHLCSLLVAFIDRRMEVDHKSRNDGAKTVTKTTLRRMTIFPHFQLTI